MNQPRSTVPTGTVLHSGRPAVVNGVLRTQPLGTSGLDITRIGLGTWAVGGEIAFGGLGPQDDNQSIATIRHAIEVGINWLDTAPGYGLGHSEKIVANALNAIPENDRPYVFTKGGMVWDGE